MNSRMQQPAHGCIPAGSILARWQKRYGHPKLPDNPGNDELADLASIFHKVQTSLHTPQQWLSETLKHYAPRVCAMCLSATLASYVFMVNGEIDDAAT